MRDNEKKNVLQTRRLLSILILLGLTVLDIFIVYYYPLVPLSIVLVPLDLQLTIKMREKRKDVSVSSWPDYQATEKIIVLNNKKGTDNGKDI